MIAHKSVQTAYYYGLYQFVFGTKPAVSLVCLMCLSFLLQPFYHAHADTDTPLTIATETQPITTEPTAEPPPPESLATVDESLSRSSDTETDGGTDDSESDANLDSLIEDNELNLTLLINEPEDAVDESSLVPSSTDASFVTSTPDDESVVSTTSVASSTILETETLSTSNPDVVTSSTSVFSLSTTTPGDELVPHNLATSSASTTATSTTENGGGDTAGGGSSGSGTSGDSELDVIGIIGTASTSSSSITVATDPNQTERENTVDPNIAGDETDEEAPPTNESLVTTVQSDSHLSFARDECTRVEDGTFYCQKAPDITQLTDALLAAPDADGDLEIFLVRNGERTQITYNTVEDASPYYDEVSRSIVWHRLINDRYQIISYDIEAGTETQLTDTHVNNMEPSRHGEYVAWQRWVENNWEIILFDGMSELQITDSDAHDIAPHIRWPLVIWNTRTGDGTQVLRTYDVLSGAYTTITDTEGVSVTNPRMVVMYEALYANGDVVTKGFDLVSGEIIPLHSLPQPLPDEIPKAQPIEEPSALIQNNNPTPKSASDIKGPNSDSLSNDVPDYAQASTTDDYTIDLRPVSSTTESTPDDLSEPKIAEPPIAPLVIPPLSTTTATATGAQTN